MEPANKNIAPMTGYTSEKQLDPQVRALLEAAARTPSPSYLTLTVTEARRLYRETLRPLAPPAPEVDEVRDLVMPGPGGPLTLRLYRPLGATAGALPALLFFHGGGWTVGDLDTHDTLCRELANTAHCVVAAVDYRLAPEHKFPAAVDDCVAAARWLAAQAAELGIDSARLALCGDSCGGNLAAVTALMLRDGGGPQPLMQVLIYPTLELAPYYDSMRRYSRGYLLTGKDMLWYRGQYLRSKADIADWRASPLRAADLSRLPPAYILTAGFDPLLDVGRDYAARLQAAGNRVVYECFEGMVHGFIVMGGVLAASQHAIYRVGQILTQTFR